MYILYTFVALAFYYIAFEMTAYGPEIGLIVVAAAFLKDTVDGVLMSGQKDPSFYRYVEHNPFNYVLVLFLVGLGYSGDATILGLTVTENGIIILATIEFIIDLLQDLETEKKIKQSRKGSGL
jgi:hypothetical protein